MRTVFTEKDPSWEITVALPMQYLNMRYFNVDDLTDQVDFYNVMTYDLHGPWDQAYLWSNQQTGTVRGHADSRDIETALDLLWRNGVTPDKVVMGLSLLGRGFLLEDTSCTTPGNCNFHGASFPSDCSNRPGINSYQGMNSSIWLCK
jgi:GH18 family chitinase